MSSESENNNTIEEKRRKNIIDNQKFLENLKLFNVRDELKSTVNLVKRLNKSTHKKCARKEKIDESEVRRSSRIQSMFRANYNDQYTLDESEVRRSSRIQSMFRANYNDQYTLDDEDFGLSTDEEDDLGSTFTTKIDKDLEALHSEELPITKNTQPVCKTGSSGVKIFLPNIGLHASKIISKDNSHETNVTKKMNVVISSSSEED